MIKRVSIVPAILTDNEKVYRAQIERINTFTKRVHIDITDGVFAPVKTLGLDNIWWPKNWKADLHLMANNPSKYLDKILKMSPSLCILHAEAKEDLRPSFQALKKAGIRTGIALLPGTYPGNVKLYIDMADHVLVFAGQLGMQGNPADLMQMEKIALIKNMKPELEIGWDGGANMTNVRALAHTDLDVIDVGAAISQAKNPAAAYQELVAETDKNGVVL